MSKTQVQLSDLRTKAGLTQRAVASALGLSAGNYNEIESGKRNLPAHHIGKLAELFNATPRQIIQHTGSARLEKLLGAFANDESRQDNNASFTVEITDDALAPRFEKGERAIVDTTKFPAADSDCAVKDKQGHHYIKRFLSRTDTHYFLLEQFSPRRTIRVPKTAIEALYAVTGRTS